MHARIAVAVVALAIIGIAWASGNTPLMWAGITVGLVGSALIELRRRAS